MKLTLSVRSFQVPPTPLTCAWPPSFPSVPTSRATRVTSEANEESWSTMVLMVSVSSRISPLTARAIFFKASPFATAVVTTATLSTWIVRFAAIWSAVPVRAAEHSFGADLAADARHFRGAGGELVHHGVNEFCRSQEFSRERTSFDFQSHRLRKITLGNGADDARNHRGRLDQVRDECIDRIDTFRPGSGSHRERGALAE